MQSPEEALQYAIDKQDRGYLIEWVLEVTTDEVVRNGINRYFDSQDDDYFEETRDGS